MLTLEQTDHGRQNNFDTIRAGAAMLVILSHCYSLTGHDASEPLRALLGYTDMGALGVGIFFSISGFLVLKSLYRQPSVSSFITARALRIFPALIVCALFCSFVIGPMATSLPIGEYLNNKLVYTSAIRLATQHHYLGSLPGVFASNPLPGNVNGSLWTLPAEISFYFLLAVLGMVILLIKKQYGSAIISLPVFLVSLVFVGTMFFPQWYNYFLLTWAFYFVTGMCFYWLRSYIPINLTGALILLTAFITAAILKLSFAEWLFKIGIVYSVSVLAYHPRLQLKHRDKRVDISYGLYIYAYPIQQLIVAKTHTGSPMVLLLLALVVTVPFAALSWRFIEKPALGLKGKMGVVPSRKTA